MARYSHAPRERVSWNARLIACVLCVLVTLHVSVWVEIVRSLHRLSSAASRSTWACELKCYKDKYQGWRDSHAPRERVSWNFKLLFRYHRYSRHAPRERVSWNPIEHGIYKSPCGHAPRERVSWNLHLTFRNRCNFVTLHVSVWVEICLWL